MEKIIGECEWCAKKFIQDRGNRRKTCSSKCSRKRMRQIIYEYGKEFRIRRKNDEAKRKEEDKPKIA